MDVASGDERGTTERVLTLLGLLQQRQIWIAPSSPTGSGSHRARYGVVMSSGCARSAIRCMPATVSVAATSSARGRTCSRCFSTTRRRSPPWFRCSPARVADRARSGCVRLWLTGLSGGTF